MAKRRRELRPLLLQAAIDQFGRDGRNVTTRALAKAVNTSDVYIYTYFKSKDKLYFEAVSEALKQANQGLTDFVMSVYGSSEGSNATQLADALRNWYSAIPQSSARLLLQVMINDETHTSPVHSAMEQLVVSVSKALEQMQVWASERTRKSNRKVIVRAAAKTLVRSLLVGKVTEGKAAQQDMEEVLQWLMEVGF